jgi:hypothetical protein
MLEKAKDSSWGYGLRYGKMAIINAIGLLGVEDEITNLNFEEIISKQIQQVKPNWQQFEDWAKNKNLGSNPNSDKEFDFDNYYKGKTITADLLEYFEKLIISIDSN